MAQQDVSALLRELANSNGQTRPATSVLTNLNVAALASKLVKPANPTMGSTGGDNVELPMVGMGVEQITRSILTKTNDSENIFKLFPDIGLAAQIIVSSVISPKDMIRSILNYRTLDSFLPSSLTSELLQILREELGTEYTLEDDLSKILHRALFESGSYVRVMLPEAAVDALINGHRTLVSESIYESGLVEKVGEEVRVTHLGFLGNPTKPQDRPRQTSVRAFETILDQRSVNYEPRLNLPVLKAKDDKDREGLASVIDLEKFRKALLENVEVVDNFQYLKMPLLRLRFKEQRERKLVQDPLRSGSTQFVTAMESIVDTIIPNDGSGGKISRKEIESTVYKSASREYQPFVKISSSATLKRKSVGRGLLLDIPSSAAIPIYHATDPSVHVGYLMPTDFDGNPVSEESRGYELGGASGFMQGGRGGGLGSYLTDKARKNLTDDEQVPLITGMSELVAELTEADLAERFANGSVGSGFKISRDQDVYRIMVSRILQGQFTRLVYVPAEYVTYFAFDFNKNGTGKSLLEDLKHITSLRATTLFATVANLIKSAITVTHGEIEISENDPDPIRTAEKAKHFIARSRQSYFPHGLNRIVDLTDWIQKAGIELVFKGNSKIPKTMIETEVRQPNRPIPSTDLDERFRHQSYMHFGLSPETVDNAARADFATTIENNSILFTRRINLLADAYSKLLSSFVGKVARFDQVILGKLSKSVETNKEVVLKHLPDAVRPLADKDPEGFVNYIIEAFLKVLVVDLPRAESRRTENIGKAFQDKEKEVEEALKYVVSEEILPEELTGNAKEMVAALKDAMKALLMRDWMAENNYAEDVLRLAQTDEDDKPMVDIAAIAKDFNMKLSKSVVTWLNEHKNLKNAVSIDIARATQAPGEGQDAGSSDQPTDDSESTDGLDEGGQDTGGEDEGGEDGEAGGDPFSGSTPFDNPLLNN